MKLYLYIRTYLYEGNLNKPIIENKLFNHIEIKLMTSILYSICTVILSLLGSNNLD